MYNVHAKKNQLHVDLASSFLHAQSVRVNSRSHRPKYQPALVSDELTNDLGLLFVPYLAIERQSYLTRYYLTRYNGLNTTASTKRAL